MKDVQENRDLPMAEAGREYDVDHSKLRRRRDGSICARNSRLPDAEEEEKEEEEILYIIDCVVSRFSVIK